MRSLLEYDGRWTPREVLALILWLPDDSAFRASAAGGVENIGWTTQTWQLKHLYDALQAQSVLMYRLKLGKKARSVVPDKFPTPKELMAQAKARAKTKQKPKDRKPAVSLERLRSALTGK